MVSKPFDFDPLGSARNCICRKEKEVRTALRLSALLFPFDCFILFSHQIDREKWGNKSIASSVFPLFRLVWPQKPTIHRKFTFYTIFRGRRTASPIQFECDRFLFATRGRPDAIVFTTFSEKNFLNTKLPLPFNLYPRPWRTTRGGGIT